MTLAILLLMLGIGQDHPILSGILFICLIFSILLWCGRGLSLPYRGRDRREYYWPKSDPKAAAPPRMRIAKPKKPPFRERHPKAAKWFRGLNITIGGISSMGLCFFCGMMLERYWLFWLFPLLIGLWWVVGASDKVVALRYVSLLAVVVYIVFGGLWLADRLNALYIFGAAAMLIGWVILWAVFVKPKNPAKNKKPDVT